MPESAPVGTILKRLDVTYKLHMKAINNHSIKFGLIGGDKSPVIVEATTGVWMSKTHLLNL